MVADAAGEGRPRVDQFLAERELEQTRSQLKRLIDAGRVSVNGAAVKASHKLRAGDEVVVVIPPPEPIEAQPENIPLDVLFEDDHLIVVDKPAGLVVHPAAGHPNGTLVNALLFHCKGLSGIGGALRPGIVHRLDKDTSGVMVATKDDATHTAMAAMFASKTIEREYIAVVLPAPDRDAGSFDTLHGRHPTRRKKFSSRVKDGKRAVTHYRVDERIGRAAVVRCRLETGRTHQIRVHFSDAGWPLMGDPMYSRRPKDPKLAALATTLGRQALHAAILGFVHPITNEPLRFETPLPDDMKSLIRGLRAVS